jgi:Tol biopolymer transport system component
MKKQLSYQITLLLLVILSCCKKEDPCIYCEEPFDFRVIDYEPAWSPDGKWIAFYHGTPGESGIYLISPGGENIRKWHDGIPETPAWSPDSKWIAFSEGAQIWKKKTDGDSLTQLTFEGRNFFPSWSPDGCWIVHVQSVCHEIMCGLWLIDLIEEIHHNPIVRYGSFPTFHLANNTVLYSKRWVDNAGQVYGDSLFYYNIKTGSSSEFTVLHGENYSNYDFKINWDGSKIVFTSKPRDKPQRLIWTMDADGSNLEQLADTQAYGCDWSPDGNYIVYTDARAENGRLWIMNADGSNKRQLTFEHHFINF